MQKQPQTKSSPPLRLLPLSAVKKDVKPMLTWLQPTLGGSLTTHIEWLLPNRTKRSKMVPFRVGRMIAPDEPGEQRDRNADQRCTDKEILEARVHDNEARGACK